MTTSEPAALEEYVDENGNTFQADAVTAERLGWKKSGATTKEVKSSTVSDKSTRR